MAIPDPPVPCDSDPTSRNKSADSVAMSGGGSDTLSGGLVGTARSCTSLRESNPTTLDKTGGSEIGVAGGAMAENTLSEVER
jgi:hypothetical protein